MKHKLITVLQPQEPNKFVAVHRERSMADTAKFKVKLRESLTKSAFGNRNANGRIFDNCPGQSHAAVH